MAVIAVASVEVVLAIDVMLAVPVRVFAAVVAAVVPDLTDSRIRAAEIVAKPGVSGVGTNSK